MFNASLYQCHKCSAFHVGGVDLEYAPDEDDNVWVRADCGATLGASGGDLTEIGTASVPVHLHRGNPEAVVHTKRTLHATVEVYGGVADVTHEDDGVEVTIIDHDNLEAEATT